MTDKNLRADVVFTELRNIWKTLRSIEAKLDDALDPASGRVYRRQSGEMSILKEARERLSEVEKTVLELRKLVGSHDKWERDKKE